MEQDVPTQPSGIEWIAARHSDGLALDRWEIVGALTILLLAAAALHLVRRFVRKRSAVSACAWQPDHRDPGPISRWTCKNCGGEGFGRGRASPSNCARHSRPKAL
jgi:hypothetical protein